MVLGYEARYQKLTIPLMPDSSLVAHVHESLELATLEVSKIPESKPKDQGQELIATLAQ